MIGFLVIIYNSGVILNLRCFVNNKCDKNHVALLDASKRASAHATLSHGVTMTASVTFGQSRPGRRRWSNTATSANADLFCLACSGTGRSPSSVVTLTHLFLRPT